MVSLSDWHYTVCGFNEPYWRGKGTLIFYTGNGYVPSAAELAERYCKALFRSVYVTIDRLFEILSPSCFEYDADGNFLSPTIAAVLEGLERRRLVYMALLLKIRSLLRGEKRPRLPRLAARRLSVRRIYVRRHRARATRTRRGNDSADPDGDPDRHRPPGGCVIDYLVKPGYLSQSRRRFFH